MEEKVVNDAMQIILHAGDAKLIVIETMNEFAVDKNIEKARTKIKEAGKELAKAHEIQTSLLVNEMRGEESKLGILMIHAQDHFMNAITIRDLAEIMITMFNDSKGSSNEER